MTPLLTLRFVGEYDSFPTENHTGDLIICGGKEYIYADSTGWVPLGVSQDEECLIVKNETLYL